jgi:hypothetical protein
MSSRHPVVFAIALACAGCASLWGFDDLTVGDAGSTNAADASISGDGASGSESGADAPTVQCDGGLTACGAACIDTRGDPKNCGACAHDCQGGECQHGVCQPVLIASGFTGTNDAGGMVSPLFIAVDSTDVYWTVEGVGVMKCATNGCNNQPILLAPGQQQASGFGIDATSVYWLGTTSSVQTIVKCAKGGCASQPTAVATGAPALRSGSAQPVDAAMRRRPSPSFKRAPPDGRRSPLTRRACAGRTTRWGPS